MWGIVPAAGAGTRIQPLAFSKELLPVGCSRDGATERPRAVGEYLLERMVVAGATRICFVISPGKADILSYFGAHIGPAVLGYVVQPRPAGLCDAVFRALPWIGADEQVVIGLPDTIWFPVDGLSRLPGDTLSFLLFEVERPELFDAVETGGDGWVREVRVKAEDPGTRWVWGAMRMPARVLRELHDLWIEREQRDEYLGTLVNAWLSRGGRARGVPQGEAYVDVGTLNGYREGLRLLAERARDGLDAPIARPLAATAAAAAEVGR
jgi:glucose-1-phosphate thymidylyltransferase